MAAVEGASRHPLKLRHALVLGPILEHLLTKTLFTVALTHSPEPRRWTFHDPALLRLFPLTYAVHVLEEWLTGAPIVIWSARAIPPFGVLTFVAPNVIGLALMVTGVALVSRGSRFHWIVPALATAVLLNAAGHLVGSMTTRQYSAGLLSAVTLWLPLALLTLLRVFDQANRRSIIAGVCVGALIELVVVGVVQASASG